MGFLTSIFGGDNVVVTVLVALAIVLVLIILGVWALKLVFNATGRATRGRAKRLGVVDISPVDQKRQLVLVRRDNVEHLLLIGGAQDLVIESGIATEPAAARPSRPAAAVQQQPAVPAPGTAATPASAPQRPRRSNLPADFTTIGSTSLPTRGSLRHTALVRPPERSEPDFFPSPPQRPSSPVTDSDNKADTEPVPTEAGSGSEEPDNRDEPNLDADSNETRSGETRQEN